MNRDALLDRIMRFLNGGWEDSIIVCDVLFPIILWLIFINMSIFFPFVWIYIRFFSGKFDVIDSKRDYDWEHRGKPCYYYDFDRWCTLDQPFHECPCSCYIAFDYEESKYDKGFM